MLRVQCNWATVCNVAILDWVHSFCIWPGSIPCHYVHLGNQWKGNLSIFYLLFFFSLPHEQSLKVGSVHSGLMWWFWQRYVISEYWLFHFWSSSCLLCLGKQKLMTQVLEPLPSRCKTRMEFLASGFNVAQPQLSPSGERISGWKISLSLFLLLCHSNSKQINLQHQQFGVSGMSIFWKFNDLGNFTKKQYPVVVGKQRFCSDHFCLICTWRTFWNLFYLITTLRTK